ncbi:hypothetical protein [Prevotella sp.]
MKKICKSVKQFYVCPSIEMVEVEAEGCILAGSPDVRPGGGGNTNNGSGTPGSSGQGVNVIAPVYEDGGDDDNLEG